MIGLERLQQMVEEAKQRRLEIEALMRELEESARELKARQAQEASDATAD